MIIFFFHGDAKNGAVLIKSFVEGMEEAYKIKKEQNLIPENFIFPRFSISADGTYARQEVSKEWSRRAIALSGRQLSADSKMDPNEWVKKEAPTSGEVYVNSSLKDEYTLTGAEEMNHQIDLQREFSHKRVDYVTNEEKSSVIPIADYDSSDLEYRGLGTKLLVAKRRGMNERTIESLEKRIENAAELRRRKKERVS